MWKRCLNTRLLFTLALVIFSMSTVFASAQQQQLPVWTNSFTYENKIWPYTMVGTDPSIPGQGTTQIAVELIPLRIAFNVSTCGQTVFDASSVENNVLNSPIFAGTVFPESSTPLQYVNAFQIGNYWEYVTTISPHWGLELQSTVITGASFTAVAAVGQASNDPTLGGCVGKVSLEWFFGQLLSLMSLLPQVQPNTLPIFLTYDVFALGEAPGYHGANPTGINGGVQTWVWATYNDRSNSFCGQSGERLCLGVDVSEIGHEVAEWADDPFGHTPVDCSNIVGSVLEVADPFITVLQAFPVNGFTYHLQDLAFLPYFGASTGQSINPYTFFGENTGVCPPHQ